VTQSVWWGTRLKKWLLFMGKNDDDDRKYDDNPLEL
jgi:hypothetical protein